MNLAQHERKNPIVIRALIAMGKPMRQFCLEHVPTGGLFLRTSKC